MNVYSKKEIETFASYGIIIPKEDDFVPGVHCDGKEPFRCSPACYGICYGTKGIISFHTIPLPCINVTPEGMTLADLATPIGGPELFLKNMSTGISGLP